MQPEGQAALVPAAGSGDLCVKSASELAALLRSGALTAVELVTAHLTRIQAVNPQVNALCTVDAAGSIARAVELDSLARTGHFAGPLHGIPLAVKDTFPTAGLRTTSGSRVFADHVPWQDANHVARLRAAGAVIIGKSNAAEFAYGAQTTNPLFGTTRNPYDLSRTVSGSSGGAAAALAAGLTVFADGSDLGGSIRAPAGFTGVVGLRPTSRVVPLTGAALPFDGLNVPGPMARTVEDARLMLDIMIGAAPDDPLSQGVSLARNAVEMQDLSGLRFAWCMTPAGTPIHSDVAAALAPAQQLLEAAGGRVEGADPGIGEMIIAQQTFRDLSARIELGTLGVERRSELGPEMQRTLSRADRLTVDDLIAAEAIRRRAWLRVSSFFQTHDIIVWPTNSQPAYGAEAEVADLGLDETPILVTPALGLPALAVPFGATPDGLPVSLQLIGRRYADYDLLTVARLIAHQRG